MRKFKRKIGVFAAAFTVTAIVMAFCTLFIVADRNTQKTGFDRMSNPLEISLSGDDVSVFVNGREKQFSIALLYDVLESKLTHMSALVWFFV